MLKRVLFLLIFTIALSLSSPLYAGGLTTTLGEVKIENLKRGERYSLQELAGFPLIIQNTSPEEIELKIEILYPQENELKEGFAAIPDISWITLERDHFILGPAEEARTDLLIHIPEDRKYQGAKFQVYLWSRTIGRAIGVGLKSRLLFTIAEEDE